MGLKTMLVDKDPARSAILEQALRDAGHSVIVRVSPEDNLMLMVNQYQPDVIIIDMDTPGRDTLEQMREIGAHQPRPIIMFSGKRDSHYIQDAVHAGVSAYVVDGLSQERIMPIVDVAIARFREFQALRRELDETKHRLADRKVVEKAKGLLMDRKGMTEEQAYQFLRKTAMNQNTRIAEVARLLLSFEDMLS